MCLLPATGSSLVVASTAQRRHSKVRNFAGDENLDFGVETDMGCSQTGHRGAIITDCSAIPRPHTPPPKRTKFGGGLTGRRSRTSGCCRYTVNYIPIPCSIQRTFVRRIVNKAAQDGLYSGFEVHARTNLPAPKKPCRKKGPVTASSASASPALLATLQLIVNPSSAVSPCHVRQ